MNETQLIHILRTSKGFVSGGRLSKEMHVSRNAIWKHIEALRKIGYKIEAEPRRGYRFCKQPDRLIPGEIKSRLRTRTIGNTLLTYETLDSTNRLVHAMGAQGVREGLVVFAEKQTQGRGRLGRKWESPAYKGLYFSILLRPALTLDQAPKITLTAAVAIARTLDSLGCPQVQIRWPNDCLLKGKKVCGILTEMKAESDQIQYVTLGIGLNVNTALKQLPPQSTSLRASMGRHFERCELAARLLAEIEKDLERLTRGEFKKIAREWEDYSYVSGKLVTAQSLKGPLKGVALGIDEEGALLIRSQAGLATRLLSGDITYIR